jgi:hypothetical protein
MQYQILWSLESICNGPLPEEGGTFAVTFIKMIALMFISLMNLVLKKKSLEVY